MKTFIILMLVSYTVSTIAVGFVLLFGKPGSFLKLLEKHAQSINMHARYIMNLSFSFGIYIAACLTIGGDHVMVLVWAVAKLFGGAMWIMTDARLGHFMEDEVA